jgi:peptidoglycan hydrolase CwlO-like protein
LSRGWPYAPWPSAGYAPASPLRVEDEIAALEESKRNLQEELKGIEARIEELQKPPKKESA